MADSVSEAIKMVRLRDRVPTTNITPTAISAVGVAHVQNCE
jgi:hypothetical protein